MNLYSKRTFWPALVMTAFLAGACGGSSDSGSATDKASWDAKHAGALKAVNIDVDTANGALGKGDRPVILSSCNQLQEDLADVRKALPVTDPGADGALRTSLDAVRVAVASCLEGGRVASNASIVEQAQRDMKAARARLDDAGKAIAAWR